MQESIYAILGLFTVPSPIKNDLGTGYRRLEDYTSSDVWITEHFRYSSAMVRKFECYKIEGAAARRGISRKISA